MNRERKTWVLPKWFVALGFMGPLVAVVAPSAGAGTFSVTPVRMYMTPQDRAIAVTITNDGDDELLMQADLYLWKQKPDGQDDLTPTEEMFLSPPIIKLAPKSRQVVRLARLGAGKPTQQLTYRMIVREVPEARPAQADIRVQVALAFSMPVFVSPPGVKAKLDCKLEKESQTVVRAICENSGNAYSHPTSLQVTSIAGDKIASDDVGAYLLPGIKRSFELKRIADVIPSGKVKLTATLDDGSNQTYDITLGN